MTFSDGTIKNGLWSDGRRVAWTNTLNDILSESAESIY